MGEEHKCTSPRGNSFVLDRVRQPRAGSHPPTKPRWLAHSLTAFSLPGPSEMLVIPGSPPLGYLQRVQKQRVPEEGNVVLSLKLLEIGNGWERTQLVEPGSTSEPSELVFPNTTTHHRN